MTIKALIMCFFDGATEGFSGTKSSPGNLKIIDNQLIHYQTPIVERYEKNKLIVNLTQYSIQTGNVQKQLKQILGEEDYIYVKKVPRDYKGSLKDFIN